MSEVIEEAVPLSTSAEALSQLKPRELARQQRELLECVVAAMRHGAQDLTRTELRDFYERTYGRRIDSNRVSARVIELLRAGRLHVRAQARTCSVTKRQVEALYVTPEQQRMFA